MKGQKYLTKEGQKIFNEIAKHLESAGVLEIDSFKLSALANAFDLHAKCCMDLNKNGYSQETSTGYSQVRAEVTLWQKSMDAILKLSPVFGIDPASREKIMAFSTSKTELKEF